MHFRENPKNSMEKLIKRIKEKSEHMFNSEINEIVRITLKAVKNTGTTQSLRLGNTKYVIQQNHDKSVSMFAIPRNKSKKRKQLPRTQSSVGRSPQKGGKRRTHRHRR
jgi:hypothetical protein